MLDVRYEMTDHFVSTDKIKKWDSGDSGLKIPPKRATGGRKTKNGAERMNLLMIIDKDPAERKKEEGGERDENSDLTQKRAGG